MMGNYSEGGRVFQSLWSMTSRASFVCLVLALHSSPQINHVSCSYSCRYRTHCHLSQLVSTVKVLVTSWWWWHLDRNLAIFALNILSLTVFNHQFFIFYRHFSTYLKRFDLSPLSTHEWESVFTVQMKSV